MNTQLRAWCAGVLEAAVLLSVAAVPVFVNYYSYRVFEQDKAGLLVALALVGALAALVVLAEGGLEAVRGLGAALRRPLVGATAALGVVTALATAASIAPRISFFGSLDRAQGLLQFLACLLLFTAAAWLGREPARRRRVLAAMILASVPVAAYAIVQVMGLQVVPGKVEGPLRAFGTLSNPIFLGAYLMLVIPVTLSRIMADVREGRGVAFAGYVVIALLQIIALLLSASRGPQLGLAVALVVLALAGGIASGRRGLAWSMLGVAAVGLVFLVVFNLPNSPLAAFKTAPVVGRFGEIGDVPGTSGAARMAIWRSVNHLLVGEPGRLALGHGPETLKYALLPFAEPNLGGTGQRGFLADRSHSVLLDALVTTGIPGALALLLVYAAWLYTAAVAGGLAAGAGDRRRLVLCLGLGTALGASSWLVRPVYGGAVTVLGLVGGLVLYLILALVAGKPGPSAPASAPAAEPDAPAAPPVPVNLTALALLAVGAAAVTEAAFGIQTVVTQVLFWTLAGLTAAVGLGDAVAAVDPASAALTAAVSRQRRPLGGRAAATAPGGANAAGAASAPGAPGGAATITLGWSPAGAAMGLVAGVLMALLIYSLAIYGTPPLADTYLALFALLTLTWLGSMVAASDAGDGALLAGLLGLVLAGAYAILRLAVLAMAQDATALFAITVVWLLLLALLAGYWLRARPAKAPFWAGPFGIAYALVAVVPVTLVFLWAIRPTQADMYFQSAVANFGAAVQGEMADATRFKAAEALFDTATQTNPDQALYPMLWSERWVQLGSATGGDLKAAANAFGKAQALSEQAERLEPQLPYHAYNRGHLQLIFAQLLPAGQRESVAKSAGDALQEAFNKVPGDPQVAIELGLARLLERNYKESLNILQYVRDHLDKNNPDVYAALGQAYREAGDKEQSKAALDQAVKLGSTDPQTYITLGEVARDAKDFPSAIDYYNQALRHGSHDWQVVYNLGLLYRDSGDFNKGLDALTAALKYAPEDQQPRIQEAIDGLLQKNGGAGSGLPGAQGLPGGAPGLPGGASRLPGGSSGQPAAAPGSSAGGVAPAAPAPAPAP